MASISKSKNKHCTSCSSLATNEFRVEDAGYESDSGERDIPTVANFEHDTPVEQNGGFRRAAEFAVSWPPTAGRTSPSRKSFVSRETVSRAVNNIKYLPRDRVGNDYDSIDPQFLEKCPPTPEYYLPGRQIRRKAIKRDIPDEVYDELLTPETSEMVPLVPHKRTQEDSESSSSSASPATATEINVAGESAFKRTRYSNNITGAQDRPTASPALVASSSSLRRSPDTNFSPAPRSKPFAPIPLPRRSLLAPRPPKSQSTAPSLAGFLKTMCDVGFSSHQALLEALGFTVPRLCTVATWRKDELQDAFTRLLSEDTATSVGFPTMNAVTAITFEIAIRALKCVPPAQAPLTRSFPPPGMNTTNSGTTLLLFLCNVMGLDLSAHQNLLDDQGCDIAALSAMIAWERARLQEVLRRGLGGRTSGGMQALVVLPMSGSVVRIQKSPVPTAQNEYVLPSLAMKIIFITMRVLRGYDYEPHQVWSEVGFEPVRENPTLAEPRTSTEVRFGFGSGSESVLNPTPATLGAGGVGVGILYSPSGGAPVYTADDVPKTIKMGWWSLESGAVLNGPTPQQCVRREMDSSSFDSPGATGHEGFRY
ncbi:hypothetical protein B0H16DRAFT_1449794 [Mycena metata]|uniref:Uncharacterized protein n=1 Tax=Mycena metata TaxID=1033252 RepID=A0AAD7K1J4_9AGAR|nr:hypothetical protein B0H16DRAFT_1449794 [Mycena metata]